MNQGYDKAHSQPLQPAWPRLQTHLRRVAYRPRSSPWELGTGQTKEQPPAHKLRARHVKPVTGTPRGLRTCGVPLSGHPPSLARAVAVLARCVPSTLDWTHGASVDALRPACKSWMPTLAACVCAKSTIRRRGAICESVQSPASCGEMRPSGTTAVPSMTMAPAPRDAKPCPPKPIPKQLVPSALGNHLCAREEKNTHADVHQVPVRRVTVVRAVLAHRRLREY